MGDHERRPAGTDDLQLRLFGEGPELFAITGGDVSSALVDAHERAVASAVGCLEREACRTRRGHGGVESMAAPGGSLVPLTG